MSDPTMPIMAMSNNKVLYRGFVCGSKKPCHGELVVNGTTITDTGPSALIVISKLEKSLRSLLKKEDLIVVVDMDKMTTNESPWPDSKDD